MDSLVVAQASEQILEQNCWFGESSLLVRDCSYQWGSFGLLKATLEEFKALSDGVPAEVQAELYKLMTADSDAFIRRMVEIAAEKGMTVTSEEVSGFLRQMDDDDEFVDFELDAVDLAAIAGGVHGRSPC